MPLFPPGSPALPSYSVTPGNDRAALINSLISAASLDAIAEGNGAKRTVSLERGTYRLESPIVAKSYVVLDCNGSVLIADFTGSADSQTNALILADSSIMTASIDTTPSAVVKKNVSSITVTATGSVAAGHYLLVHGHNTASYPQDGLNESTGDQVILYEVIQVSSSYTTGSVLPTSWPFHQYHGTSGVQVRRVDPIIGFEVRNAKIRGNPNSTTAVGVFARYCLDTVVEGIEASGFTRYALEFQGVKGLRIPGYLNRGQNNGWMLFTSVIDGQIDDVDGVEGVARYHNSGSVRYPIMVKSRCVNMDFGRVRLTNTYAGMYLCGSQNSSIDTLSVSNVYIDVPLYDRMVSAGELDNTSPVMLGLGLGYGPIAKAEFGWDLTVNKIRTENLRVSLDNFWTVTTPTRARAVYLHDYFSSYFGSVVSVNRGDTSDQTLVSGVTISDLDGHIDSINVGGHLCGLIFENSQNSVRIDNYNFRGGSGVSPNSTIPIILTHTVPSAHQISFGRVAVSNASTAFRTGGSFVGDGQLSIEHFIYDGAEWKDLVIARNESATSFTRGDVVEVDNTYTGSAYLRVVSPSTGTTGYERRLAAVATAGPNDPGTGFMLVTKLPSRLATITASTGAVAFGGLIEYFGTRRCAENSASLHPFGSSLSYKAGGAEGSIRIGIPVD